jgi:hypothetical protein
MIALRKTLIRSGILFIFILLGVLLFPNPASADGYRCYQVDGAGYIAVNGKYKVAGWFNNRPLYSKQGGGYFIAYEAVGFINEWDITDLKGDDIYYMGSTAPHPPEGQWYVGWGPNGIGPGPSVRGVVCRLIIPKIEDFEITPGERNDHSSGRFGVFMPSAFTEATLRIIRIPPFGTPYHWNLNQTVFSYIKVTMMNEEGMELEKFYEVNYVYFNLNTETLKLWESGNLGIYRLDGKFWSPVDPVYFVQNGDESNRLSILVSEPGEYVLATK